MGFIYSPKDYVYILVSYWNKSVARLIFILMYKDISMSKKVSKNY